MAGSGHSFVPDGNVHALVTDQYALLAAGLLPSAFGLLTPKKLKSAPSSVALGKGAKP